MQRTNPRDQFDRIGVVALVISGLSGLVAAWKLGRGSSGRLQAAGRAALRRAPLALSLVQGGRSKRRSAVLRFLSLAASLAQGAARPSSYGPLSAGSPATSSLSSYRTVGLVNQPPAQPPPLPKPISHPTATKQPDKRPLGRGWWAVLKLTYENFSEHKIPRLGAAMAYYTVFSLAPMLLIAVAVASLAFGEEAVNNQLSMQMQGMLGDEAAEAIEAIITSAREAESGGLATMFGVILLLFGASGVFVELQDALNTIWEVPAKKSRGIWSYLRDRGFSFAMVLVMGFLLLVSLVVSAAIAALQSAYGDLIPGPDFVLSILNALTSLTIITLLFVLIFKFLPDAKVAWRHAWSGALFTAVMFTLGKFAIGLYLGRASVTSAYGAAGSLVVILIWAYYSAQLLLTGAEFTYAKARIEGDSGKPTAPSEVLIGSGKANFR